MTLKEIYQDKKRELDEGYVEFWNKIRESIENDSDYSLSDDEIDQLIYDLMISNVMGRVIRYDDIVELMEQAEL